MSIPEDHEKLWMSITDSDVEAAKELLIPEQPQQTEVRNGRGRWRWRQMWRREKGEVKRRYQQIGEQEKCEGLIYN